MYPCEPWCMQASCIGTGTGFKVDAGCWVVRLDAEVGASFVDVVGLVADKFVEVEVGVGVDFGVDA